MLGLFKLGYLTFTTLFHYLLPKAVCKCRKQQNNKTSIGKGSPFLVKKQNNYTVDTATLFSN